MSSPPTMNPIDTPPWERRILRLQGQVLAAVALIAAGVAVALTIKTYMPCPYWDGWSEVNAIARGAGFSAFTWLWSQHNEHRVLITRLLMLVDLRALGGRGVSLTVEILALQFGAWLAVCFAAERFTGYPRFLKTSIEGLFGFCFFHLNQAENFTNPFQIAFILPFALAVVALLAVAFFDRLRRPWLAACAAGLFPFAAALNLAGGFLIGPVAIALGWRRRMPPRYLAAAAVLFCFTVALYLAGYRASDPNHRPLEALLQPKKILVYLLTYLGASWTRLLPHKERLTAFISLAVFVFLLVRLWRIRNEAAAFEWFCSAACALAVSLALLTALGRLQFGVGQAYAGRYQTPAMLYWASLGSLLLIAAWRSRPSTFIYFQSFATLAALLSLFTFLPIWKNTTGRARLLQSACSKVMSGTGDERAAALLYSSPAELAPGIAYLHRIWGH